jgi:hypothetical protein
MRGRNSRFVISASEIRETRMEPRCRKELAQRALTIPEHRIVPLQTNLTEVLKEALRRHSFLG